MASPGQVAKQLEQVRRKMLIYKTEWPRRAGVKALEFVDGNFRAQGYRDKTLIPWRYTVSGKFSRFGGRSEGILQQTGRLRRGMQMSPRKEAVRIFNAVKYARVHNEGFRGAVTVKAHTRRRKLSGTISGANKEYAYGANMSLKTRRALKDKAVTMDSQVKQHTRQMDIRRRQFMPSASRGSQMLVQEIQQMTRKDIGNILKAVR